MVICYSRELKRFIAPIFHFLTKLEWVRKLSPSVGHFTKTWFLCMLDSGEVLTILLLSYSHLDRIWVKQEKAINALKDLYFCVMAQSANMGLSGNGYFSSLSNL